MQPFLLLPTTRGLLLALAYLLAACDRGATGSVPPTLGPIVRDTPIAVPTQPALPTAATAESAETPPIATTQAGAATLLISYHKSGGIAGVNETLTVYANGTVEIRDKSGTISTRADPSDIQALDQLLDSPAFAALQLPLQPPAPDQFIYELTVPDRAKPIVTVDGADNPPVLREVLDVLEKLKTQAK